VVYRIDFSPEADEHIAQLKAHDRATLLDAIARQVAHQPTLETRHRKPLRPNPVAQYRLRVGRVRVYYDVEVAPDYVVVVKAVGIKVRNRVYVAGKEIQL
jgi:mRNA-degrading endonuclease RelE of RelBE toxin-antitoxin system